MNYSNLPRSLHLSDKCPLLGPMNIHELPLWLVSDLVGCANPVGGWLRTHILLGYLREGPNITLKDPILTIADPSNNQTEAMARVQSRPIFEQLRLSVFGDRTHGCGTLKGSI